MSERAPNDGMLLPGLDGANPLGFLAALGVQRVLTLQNHGVKLSWHLSGGAWRPELFGVRVPLPDLGAELHAAIRNLDQSAWSIDKKLPFDAAVLRQRALEAAKQSTRHCRKVADDLSAFGVECFKDDKGNFKDTRLRMVRAGDAAGQGLLAYGKRIIESTTADEIQTAAAETWLYQDKQCALRWDPAEDRGYALQWGNPSDDGALSVRGANCLALLAMAILPAIPARGQVETTGFGLKEPKRVSLTWPVWQHPIGLCTVGSLMATPELQERDPSRQDLSMRGIAAAYRCDRVMTSTYYANFTPARRIA